MYKKIVKRLLDFMLALLGLLITFPITISVALILLLVNRGNPFFFQKRPGKDAKVFKIIKFKTMINHKDASGKLLPDSERLTSIGKWVRKYSLDELPQLINVLIGDMAFVGPRPLLIKYLPYYTAEEHKRHQVRPGITGLAQISGRNYLNWDDRLKKDVWYVEQLSFKLDLEIMIKTVKNVLTSKDVAINPNLIIQDLDDIRKTN